MVQFKINISIVALLYLTTPLVAQVKKLNFDSYKSWPRIPSDKIKISNNGKYVVYEIDTLSGAGRVYIESLGQTWRRVLQGVPECYFTADSRHVIIELHDSMGVLDLETDKLIYLGNAVNFRIPKEGNGHLVAYMDSQLKGELVVDDLSTDKKIIFKNIKTFGFNDEGTVLWMESEQDVYKREPVAFEYLDLKAGAESVISRGHQYKSVQFDRNGTSLAFWDEDSTGAKLFYFKPGMDSAEKIVDLSNTTWNISKSRNISFNQSGSRLFFAVEKRGVDKKPAANSLVKIQSYTHELLELKQRQESTPFLASVSILRPMEPLWIGRDYDFGRYLSSYRDNDYFIFEKKIIERKAGEPVGMSEGGSLYLVNTNDCSRIPVKGNGRYIYLSSSITGKYIIWFDEDKGHWFTFNIDKRLRIDITSQLNARFAEVRKLAGYKINIPSGRLVGWMEDDTALIIQDRYDLWRVDPDGKRPPSNIDHGFGRKNHIQLRYLDLNYGEKRPIHATDSMLLVAFSSVTKGNGFYRLTLGGGGKLKPLSIETGKVYYYGTIPHECPGAQVPLYPIKAKFAEKYIIEQMSATEYPNLYATTDFRNFKPITKLEPQREYNWYTTELHQWSLPDGERGQGILYKPKNFDPKVKYPVILFYYEEYTDALNVFIHPELSNGIFNIPWFVSNGYLVFVPDIHYKVGYPGQSAYNYVVSAAYYLSRMSFVDSRHLGLHGHSFGGFETNYIISHTSLFAAAASGAGVVDLPGVYVESYGYYEQGQGRIGATLWQRPDLYIANSALFKADRVTTPLLIMHNEHDPIVPFQQGMEWFDALSRLGKQVWMLSYEGESHGIDNENSRLDYSVRLAQFFDHFLKQAPAPNWMTEELILNSTRQ